MNNYYHKKKSYFYFLLFIQVFIFLFILFLFFTNWSSILPPFRKLLFFISIFYVTVKIIFYFGIIKPGIYTLHTLLELTSYNESIQQKLTHITSQNKHEILQELKQLRMDELDQNYKKQLIKKETIISALQNQINPHFLYNTLDCIRGEAIIRKQYEIAEMTKALSIYFRYNISNSSDLVTLKDETRNIENYFKIQQFRFEQIQELNIQYDPDCPYIMDTLIPKLTLQPVVENAIIHGLTSKSSKGTITLEYYTTDTDLIIHCIDNGIGMDPAILDKLVDSLDTVNLEENLYKSPKKSIALKNVHSRIKLYFGNDYGINISSLKNVGTDVEIRIPLKTQIECEVME